MPRTNVVGTTAAAGSGAQRCAQAGEREHRTDSTTGTAVTTAANRLSPAARAADSRNSLQFHPLADIFPLMEGEEFDALVADIKANGLHERIILHEGMILDGRNRYRALLAAGLDPANANTLTIDGAKYVDDPVAFVISANIHRRHLTAGQKRDLIKKLIKAAPEKSNRQIAKATKVSHPHVAKVRAEMEEAGDVETVSTSIDTKGRKQPVKTAERRRKAAEERKIKREQAAAEAAEQRRAEQAEGEAIGEDVDYVAPPQEIKTNILHSIDRQQAITRAYRKIIRVSSLDTAAKDEVSAAIGRLITNLQSLQRALRTKTAAEVTAATTERSKRHRALSPLRNGENAADPASAPLPQAPEADEVDNPGTNDDGLDIPECLRRSAQ
jgi:hypothetical protein